jgi:hypothetical protein
MHELEKRKVSNSRFGMYECKDVEIYSESAMTPEKDKKLGKFGLEEK